MVIPEINHLSHKTPPLRSTDLIEFIMSMIFWILALSSDRCSISRIIFRTLSSLAVVVVVHPFVGGHDKSNKGGSLFITRWSYINIAQHVHWNGLAGHRCPLKPDDSDYATECGDKFIHNNIL